MTRKKRSEGGTIETNKGDGITEDANDGLLNDDEVNGQEITTAN